MALRSCVLRQRECTLHGQDHPHLLLSHPVVPGGGDCAPGSVCRMVWLCFTPAGPQWNLLFDCQWGKKAVKEHVEMKMCWAHLEFL